MSEEGTMLHHFTDMGGAEMYLDDEELAKVQHLMYYCDGCTAYHRKPEVDEGFFVKTLNSEVEE